MSPILLYVLVFLISATPFLESTLIIPIAIIAGLNVWTVTIVGIGGNLLTFLIAVVLAERIVQWKNKRSKTTKKRNGNKINKAKELWRRYGLPGLAIIHPVTIGSSHATALIALSLGASKKATIVWVGGSVTIWAVLFAILSFIGADFIYVHLDTNGFLNQWFDLP
ncbi:small multi-drug export protein [Geomicrobium sp. JCM 19039]|uniref:small multi-drug export protein n=1 Tax=Geomicrobium sp. JCM 19039 TaxID=1460636 RepID=UPI00045F16BE|nr:small multi-drug export protein [Geomicrobium sp. JCM 19039]GAK13569.1 hypothetical protein JCM19039_3428 [Geomicrobium sp. JCM 19039]